MKTIYKYPITYSRQEILMPSNANILHCGYDPNGVLCIWAFLDTDQPKQMRTFLKIGTGWPLDDFIERYDLHYIATINEEPYVWHIYELLSFPMEEDNHE